MIGDNELYLNEETVTKALQHWFDTVLYKEGQSPKVVAVSSESKSYGPSHFVVKITSEAKPPVPV